MLRYIYTQKFLRAGKTQQTPHVNKNVYTLWNIHMLALYISGATSAANANDGSATILYVLIIINVYLWAICKVNNP